MTQTDTTASESNTNTEQESINPIPRSNTDADPGIEELQAFGFRKESPSIAERTPEMENNVEGSDCCDRYGHQNLPKEGRSSSLETKDQNKFYRCFTN